MPGFLSKVFGRGKKREEKHNKDAPSSPLGGKFEDVKLSPTASNSHENGSKATSKVADRTSPTTREVPSKVPTAPHLSLNLPGPKEVATSRALGGVFEAAPDSREIGERQLNPLEALVLLKTCGQAIVERGLETLGLMHPHWHSASPEVQTKLISLFIQSLDSNGPKTTASSTESATTAAFESEVQFTRSPHDVAAVFRWGLRHLQFKESSTLGKDVDWYSQFYNKERSSSHPPTAFSDQLAPLVPTSHLELLKYTLETISYIAAHAEGTGVSGSRLTKFIALWLLDPQGSRTGKTWSELYEKWEKAGRMLEHLFLAHIRDETARHQMPLRLTQLTTQYPYGPTADTSMLPAPRFTTRAHDALLITLEVPYGSDSSNIHPVKLVSEVYNASAAKEDDNTPEADLWAKIKSRHVSSDAESPSTAVPPLSYIFSDETIRLISLTPADLSAGTVFSTSGFNLHTPTVTRRRSSSLRAHSPSVETPTQSNGNENGHGHAHQKSVSSVSGSVSERPSLNIVTKPLGATDWGLFSQSGFLEDSTLGAPLAATLMDRDVETTSPPAQPTRRKSVKKNRGRQSLDLPAPALPSPQPVSPSPPTEEQSQPEHGTYRTKVLKVDEAFIDFWSDSLTDPISSRWPHFFIYQLKRPIEQQENDAKQTIEWIVLERTVAAPPPPPPTMEPVTPVSSSSHVPTSAGGATPTRPRAGSPKPSVGSLGGGRSRFSLFSSVSSLGKSNSNKSKRSASTKKGTGTSKIGEMGEVLSEEKEGRRSMTVSKAPENVPIPESPMVEAQRPLPPSPLPPSPGEELPAATLSAPTASAVDPNPPPAAAQVSTPPVAAATHSEDNTTHEEKKDSHLGGAAVAGAAGLAAGGASFAVSQHEHNTQQEVQNTEDSPANIAEQTEATKPAEETLESVPGETSAPISVSTQAASPAMEDVSASTPAPVAEATSPIPADEVTPPAPAEEVTPPAAALESESPTTRAPPPAPLNLPLTALDSTPVNNEDDEDQEDPTESPIVDRHSHMVMAAAAEKYHDKAGHERVVITPCASVHEDDDPMDEVDDDEEEDDLSIPEQPSVGASTIIAPTPVTVDDQHSIDISGDAGHGQLVAERAQADPTPVQETADSEHVPDATTSSSGQPPALLTQDSVFTSAVPVGGHTLSLQEAIAHADAHVDSPSPVAIPEPTREDSPEAHTEPEASTLKPTFTAEQATAIVPDETPNAAVSEPEIAAEEVAPMAEDAPVASVSEAARASNAEEAERHVEEPTTSTLKQSPLTVQEPSASVENTPVVIEVADTHPIQETLPEEEKITEQPANEVVAEPAYNIAEPDQVVEVPIVDAGEAVPLATASTMNGAESAPIDEELSQHEVFAPQSEVEPEAESQSAPVETPTQAEEPIHKADEPIVAAEVPEVAQEEPTVNVEEPEPVAEASIPQTEESAPVVEAPPLRVEEPHTAVETTSSDVEPAKSGDEPSAHAEEPSQIQQPIPADEESTPVKEGPIALPAIVGTTFATPEPASSVDVEEETSSIQEPHLSQQTSAAVPEALSHAAEHPTPSLEQDVAARSEDSMDTSAQETVPAPVGEHISASAHETANPIVVPVAPILESAAATEERPLTPSEPSPVTEVPTPAPSGTSPAAQLIALPVDGDNDVIDNNASGDAPGASVVDQTTAPVQQSAAAVEEPTLGKIDSTHSSDDITPVTSAAPSPVPSPALAESSLPVVDAETPAPVDSSLAAIGGSTLPQPSAGTEQESEPAASTGSDESQQFVFEKPSIEPLRDFEVADPSQDSTELPPVPVVDVAPAEASPVLMPKAVEQSPTDITPAAVDPISTTPATEVLETGSTPGPELALASSAAPPTTVPSSTEEGSTDVFKAESFDTEPALPNADSTPKVEEESFLPAIVSNTLVDDRKPTVEATQLPSGNEEPSNPEAEPSPVANPAATSAPTFSDSPSDTKSTNV